MENDFLHKISVEKLSKELNLSVDEIAVLAGIKHSKNLGKWAQSKPDGSRPNYNALINLLRAGASVETLFGVDYKGPAKPSVNGDQIQPEIDKIHIDYQDPKFQELVEKALIRIEERKKQGIIK